MLNWAGAMKFSWLATVLKYIFSSRHKEVCWAVKRIKFVKGIDSVNLDPMILNQSAYTHLIEFMLAIIIT